MRPLLPLLLMALAMCLLMETDYVSVAATTTTPATQRSRFLAAVKKINPKAFVKKCHTNPAVCAEPGSPGPDCCGTSCVDTATDVFNCGKCGKVCKYTESCCAGKCLDLYYNKRHCGSCGNQCAKGTFCIYGMCSYA